jgi:hypothetical protein
VKKKTLQSIIIMILEQAGMTVQRVDFFQTPAEMEFEQL